MKQYLYKLQKSNTETIFDILSLSSISDRQLLDIEHSHIDRY